MRNLQPIWQQHAIPMAILIVAGSIILFFGLGYQPIDLWDESRLAVNAAEMVNNKHFLVTYYDGNIDHYNTKPPLLIWLMAVAIHYFGFNELAIRLFPALAGLATAIFIYFYLSKRFADTPTALSSAIVLLTTVGFVWRHGARSGNYDALLALWTTIFILYFYDFLQGAKHASRSFTIFCIAVVLAVWTKSVQGLIFLPALLLYALITRRIGYIIRLPVVYIGVIAATIAICLYYITREFVDPGYFNMVMMNEFAGRYFKDQQGDYVPFYYGTFLLRYGKPWVLLLPFSLWTIFNDTTRETKQFVLFIGICILFYFIIIQLSQTKYFWYLIPIYPLIAIIIGLGLAGLVARILKWVHLGNRIVFRVAPGGTIGAERLALGALLFVAVITAVGYQNHVDQESKQQPELWYGYFLKFIQKKLPEINQLTIVHRGHPRGNPIRIDFYVAPELFYQMAFNANGYKVSIKKPEGEFSIGERLIYCGKSLGTELERKYQLTQELAEGSCRLSQLVSGKLDSELSLPTLPGTHLSDVGSNITH